MALHQQSHLQEHWFEARIAQYQKVGETAFLAEYL